MSKVKINELEKEANKSNLRYRKENKALILKVPTPIIYTSKGLIPKKSTVDYVGLIKGGKFIAFDAKETQSKTSFPLSNIKQHQLIYLNLVESLGGIAFFFIHFKKLYKDKAFVTPLSIVNYYSDENRRNSIPISDFKESWLVNIHDYLETWLNDRQ